ncbi:MAG: type II secretion system F family protein [Candidatus Saccharimonadales bacterium]
MPSYAYSAKNPTTGQVTKSTIEAGSESEAAKAVKGQGLVPVDIKAERAASLQGFSSKLNRVKAKDKVLFFRQLSTLINAGLPLSQSLRNVADQTKNKKLKAIINDIISSVEGGKTLSSSLGRYPDVFNRVIINLVAAGETSGTLDQALERIANQVEKEADIASKVRNAMIYPIIIVLVMLAVVAFMMIKVVPQIKMLYTSFPGASLPIETRALLAVSHFVSKDWWVVALILIVGGVAFSRWIKTESGRKVIDRMKLNAPPFKTLFKMIYMARFSRTSATLIGAGVPLLNVLQIAAENVANYHVGKSIQKAADKVKGGKSLGDSLTGDPNFLPLVPNMLKIGEASGSVEAMLNKAADYYEKEVDNIIGSISTIIEPVLMILLGIVAMIIVAAILLPIYSLAGSGAISTNGV